MAWEYGAPWNGAGAFSVLITMLSVIRSVLSWAGSACLREGNAQRLEDRLEHVVGIGTVDQADVERQRRAFDHLAEERGDEVGGHPAQPRLGEIDVGNEQRSLAHLEGSVRERFGGRNDCRSVTGRALGAERLRE